MIERTCIENGCTSKHRARGLCSTHYNIKHQPNRHAKASVECEVCGAEVQRYVGHDYRHVCSTTCRAALDGGTYHPDRLWSVHAQRRARKAGATVVETFEREEILERDGRVCYLCAQPIGYGHDPLSSMSPSIDHVVPLSQGGQHTRDNVRATHYGCNSRRGDRPTPISSAG